MSNYKNEEFTLRLTESQILELRDVLEDHITFLAINEMEELECMEDLQDRLHKINICNW